MSFCCPNCGSQIGEAQSVDVLTAGDLSPQQRKIIGAMQSPVGAWVSSVDIAAAVWGDGQKLRRATPLRRTISVLITRMQGELVRYGWTIASDRRGNYKLIPMERGA
jgi:hypothetical protein